MSGSRADLVRLRERIATGERGALLLSRKRRILSDELEKFRLHCDELRERWHALAADAAVWRRRAHALDGALGIEAAWSHDAAELEVTWSTTMGLVYPSSATTVLPERVAVSGSSALAFAVEAHQHALSAAALSAAADRAVRLLERELASASTRQRAVEDRWLPRLHSDLADIRARLDEQELEESLRVRWGAESARAGGAR